MADETHYGYADDEGNVIPVATFTDATDAAGRLGMDVVAQIGDGPWQSLPAEMTDGAPHPLRHMDADARPDAGADQAGGIYADVIRRVLALRIHGDLLTADELADEFRAWAASPWYPRVVEAARDPLAAEIERLGHQLRSADARINWLDGNSELIAALAAQRDELATKLAEAIRERDEARAKVDGGESAAVTTAVAGLIRRVATQHQQVTELVEQHMAEIAREIDRVGRVLPVEAVGDDGSGT